MLLNSADDARLSALAQLGLITIASALLTSATIVMNFGSGWNALWIIALPAALGFFLNRDLGSKCSMALTLTATSIVIMLVSGNLIGYD